MGSPEIIYQAWCYYEYEDTWKMEGFFRTENEAHEHISKLRDSAATPCMPDYAVIEVKGWW